MDLLPDGRILRIGGVHETLFGGYVGAELPGVVGAMIGPIVEPKRSREELYADIEKNLPDIIDECISVAGGINVFSLIDYLMIKKVEIPPAIELLNKDKGSSFMCINCFCH